ncbi:MAG: hypothetical protein EOM36_06570 [Bacteroidia bacterium]|nr:hypothetical protein [Bacteroidia bacterium]
MRLVRIDIKDDVRLSIHRQNVDGTGENDHVGEVFSIQHNRLLKRGERNSRHDFPFVVVVSL